MKKANHDVPIPPPAPSVKSKSNAPSYLTLQQLERDLQEHYKTHDPECTRFSIWGFEKPAGFGAQYNNMLLFFPISLWEDRTMVLMSKFLANYQCKVSIGNNRYTSCFKDVFLGPPSCETKVVDAYRADYDKLEEW